MRYLPLAAALLATTAAAHEPPPQAILSYDQALTITSTAGERCELSQAAPRVLTRGSRTTVQVPSLDLLRECLGEEEPEVVEPKPEPPPALRPCEGDGPVVGPCDPG